MYPDEQVSWHLLSTPVNQNACQPEIGRGDMLQGEPVNAAATYGPIFRHELALGQNMRAGGLYRGCYGFEGNFSMQR